MTIVPEKLVPLVARTSADFEQEFVWYDDAAQTTPKDLTGWSFRFVAKRSALDAASWLLADGAAVTVTPLAGRVVAKLDKTVLDAALAAGLKAEQGEWELQGTSPAGLDAVAAAGAFTLLRGL